MNGDLWQELRDDHSRYNQYVDVVSCWESLLNAEFGDNDNFFFERFPKVYHTEGGNKYKPDFSVRITEDYGILFEIKRTVGGEEKGYNRTIDQLEHYLEDISYISDGSVFPDNKDVVFLIKENNARRIARKVRSGLEERGVKTDDLIILYYSSDPLDTIFCYVFKKVRMDSPDFSDDLFKRGNPLNEAFGESNDFEGIRTPTKYFLPYRSRCPIMNDDPPPVYLASLLWTDHFYQMLSVEQKKKIRWSTGTEIIKIDIDELYELVEKDFPIYKSDINSVMEFISEGNLATRANDEKFDYELKYRRLKSTRKIYTRQESEDERIKLEELSEKFIDHYVKYHKRNEKRKKNKPKSKSLLDF